MRHGGLTELHMDVMTELQPAGEMYRAGDYAAGLTITRELWDRITEPKVEVPDAYNVLEYAVAFALKMKDLDEAWRWACLAPSFKEARQDRGEVEFLVGRVAFARDEMDTAKENFLVAKKKSRGRIFKGEDPRFLRLISQ